MKTYLKIGCAFVLLNASALAGNESEARVKAAFIYNFAKFIDWPSSAIGRRGSVFVIGAWRAREYDQTMKESLNGKALEGHPIEVQTLSSESSISNCRIVFVGNEAAGNVEHLAKLCKGRGTVLIGDGADFARNGGTIAFVVESSRVKFDINETAAEETGVAISAKLLHLARRVIR